MLVIAEYLVSTMRVTVLSQSDEKIGAHRSIFDQSFGIGQRCREQSLAPRGLSGRHARGTLRAACGGGDGDGGAGAAAGGAHAAATRRAAISRRVRLLLFKVLLLFIPRAAQSSLTLLIVFMTVGRAKRYLLVPLPASCAACRLEHPYSV